MKKNLCISIIINNYNYGHFLSQAIDSALNQNYPYKEIIVVDDGSTDNSHSIIQGYEDRIISVFKLNGGQASAFNAGFEKSSGDVICFLDSDDTFSFDKLSKIAKVFECNPNIDWCFHPLSLVSLDNRNVNRNSCIHAHSRKHNFNDSNRMKLHFNYPATSGTCFTRSCLSEVLPMPEDIRIVSDNYIKFVVTNIYKGCIFNEELAEQKIHSQNAYTLNSNYHYLKPKYDVLIAYWARIRFPALSMCTDRLLASGISGFWKVGKFDMESDRVIKSYFEAVRLKRRIQIYAKATYEVTKLNIDDLIKGYKKLKNS
jgi:glycosyltransferase involved in cell wall biosynthesis